jgi:hypothetical protein
VRGEREREGGRERGGENRKVERGVVRYITFITRKVCPLVLSFIAIYTRSKKS